MQNTPAWDICLSSLTAGTTQAFPMKRTSTSGPGPKQIISWLQNLGILWLYAEKTYNMPKNCKNEPTIKELNLKIMLLVRKFGWIANISKPNTIGSWRRSSLSFFEFCTWWVTKPTNSICQNDERSRMFSTCPC